jgi:hypothetical protein
MSKIRLLQNKELLLALGIGVTLVIVLIVNIAVIVPSLVTSYRSASISTNKSPIDEQTIKKAIEYIGQ